MFIMITGGSKSGKSSAAEKILSADPNEHYYIATMMPYGDDAREAIKRHRKMRFGKGFKTIEKYTDISDVYFPEKSSALIECIGNLCANEMFSAKCRFASDKIYRDIAKLCRKTELLIAVNNQVGEDGISYDAGTAGYIREMGKLSVMLAELADCVIEMVYGIPVILKGEKPDCM